jgi:hypothetical protein
VRRWYSASLRGVASGHGFMVDRIRSMHGSGVSSVVRALRPGLRLAKPALVLWLGLSGLATGCGQKGPLTLPASTAPAASAAAAR